MNPAFKAALDRATQSSHFIAGWSAVALILAAPISRSLYLAAGLLFAVGWITEGAWRAKALFLRDQPVTAPLLLLTLIVAVWAAASPAPAQDVVNNLKVYSKLLLVLMLAYTLRHPRWRARAWTAFALAMGLVLVSTYANVFVELPWSRTVNEGLGVDHSVFVEYVSQSGMTAIFMALCIQRAMNAVTHVNRLLWAVAAVASLISVMFLLQGRSGLVAVVVVLVIMAAAYTPRAWRWPVLLALLALLGALVVMSPLMLERVLIAYREVAQYEPFDQTSLGLRVDMWRLALDQFLSHPLLGTGSGTYHQIAAQYFGHCEYTCIHPHNQYLFLAMEYGVSGLIAFLWILWRLIQTAHRSESPERTVLYALIAVIAVDSLFNVPLWYRAQSYFFYAMLGLLLASAGSQPTTAREYPLNPDGVRSV